MRFRELIEALAAEGYAALTGDCPTVGAPACVEQCAVLLCGWGVGKVLLMLLAVQVMRCRRWQALVGR